MTLHVLFFSVLQDATGCAEASIELEPGDGETVGDLLESLLRRWPALRPWEASLLVALDLEFVGREARLAEGQEIAVMPPVQGG